MELWAHRQNIRRFEQALATEVDEKRREVLRSILALERSRLAELEAGAADPAAHGPGPLKDGPRR